MHSEQEFAREHNTTSHLLGRPDRTRYIDENQDYQDRTIAQQSEAKFKTPGVRTRESFVPNIGNRPSISDSLSAARYEASDKLAVWNGYPRYSFLWDLANILLPICFLILGGFVASLEDKPESAWSKRIIQATNIAPSIWPILFSGILGNAIKAWGDWKVERGVELLTLEQLSGSLTMAGSILTIFRWSIFRLSSVVLLLLWAFNPLGSQASLRCAYLTPRTGTYETQVKLYNSSFVTQLQLTDARSSSSRSKPTVRSLYSTTLYERSASLQYVNLQNETAKETITLLGGMSAASIQTAMDPWGNVRIPSLEYHPDYDSRDAHQWLEVPWTDSIMNYSSLLGDRVDGVDRGLVGNSTFMISSSYQALSCKPWFHLDWPSNSSIRNANRTEADRWLVQNTGSNLQQLIKAGNTNFPNTNIFLARILATTNSTAVAKATPELVFGIRNNENQQLDLTSCAMRTIYIDANATCISRGSLGKANCGVHAVRMTPRDTQDSDPFFLDLLTIRQNTFTRFRDLLDDTGLASGQSSSTERYLFDPLTAFGEYIVPFGSIQVRDITIETFERRLSLLLNTLWKISWAHRTATGAKLTEAQLGLESDSAVRPFTNTTAEVAFLRPPVYAIDYTWMSLYFLGVVIMLCAAIAAVLLRWDCKAPVLLGFVSSLLRDSRYFEDDLANTSSTEDGNQKTKRLRTLKVVVAAVGDTKSDASRIAFVPASIGSRVQTGKRYA